MAAFRSLSWTALHGHVHDRTARGFGPSIRPHTEQAWDDGKNLSTFTTTRPYRAASSTAGPVPYAQDTVLTTGDDRPPRRNAV